MRPSLDDVPMIEFSARVATLVSAGDPLFPLETVDLSLSDEQKDFCLRLCKRKTMQETSEAAFRSTDYVERLSDSVQFSKAVRNALYADFATAEKERYDRAGVDAYFATIEPVTDVRRIRSRAPRERHGGGIFEQRWSIACDCDSVHHNRGGRRTYTLDVVARDG
jgi:hypothetical protein